VAEGAVLLINPMERTVALEGVELTMLIQMGVLGIHQINRLLAVTALLPFLIRALMVGIMDQ
jgi:hypothetical protein